MIGCSESLNCELKASTLEKALKLGSAKPAESLNCELKASTLEKALKLGSAKPAFNTFIHGFKTLLCHLGLPWSYLHVFMN